MKYLRQGTAAVIAVGPFLSKADALTPLPALASQNGRAVSNGTGAAFAPTSWVYDGNGHYIVGVASTDVPTVGRIRFDWSDATTYLPTWEDFTVLAPAVYDALFGTAALSTYAGGAVASVTAAVTVGTNNDKLGYSLAAAGLDAIAVEAGLNLRQAMAEVAAALAGVISGAGTGSVSLFAAGNPATKRIQATTDSAGNRSVVTLTPPA